MKPEIPAPALVLSRRWSAPVVVAAAAGLMLTGCTVEPAPEPTGTASAPTESASTQSPTDTSTPAEDVASLQDLAQVLLPVEEFPVDEVTGLDLEGFTNQPVSMYLTVTGIAPTGECERLLDQVNSFTTPALNGVSGTYSVDDESTPEATADATSPEEPGASTPAAGPRIEVMVFATEEVADPMGIYAQIPRACGTLDNEDVPDASASFARVGNHNAVKMIIDDGQGQQESFFTGGISEGNVHVYISATGVTDAEAGRLFTEQRERLVEMMGSESAPTSPTPSSPSPSSSPTSSPTSASPTT